MASATSPKAGQLASRRTCSPKHAKYQQQQAGTVFGYSPPPEEPNLLSRDVWRFVQVYKTDFVYSDVGHCFVAMAKAV
jgi:hypothetical protein